MKRNFELGTILTFTTGINCTDNFYKAYELAWFVFDDKFITGTGLRIVKDKLKEHLLNLYPQLKDVNYIAYLETSFEAWLSAQKEKYGELLPVRQLVQTKRKLKEQTLVKKFLNIFRRN